ncbi:hypothetical protein ES703_123253 [subsurface metagenome]
MEEELAPTPEEKEELAPTTTPALPKPGEWTASTGCSEFTFTFTVSPDSKGIPEYSIDFTELTCPGTNALYTTTTGGWGATVEPMLPITGGQFSIETKEYFKYGPDWDIVIQGKFDETGTHASGTWEISVEGTTCQAGTWESSR